MTCNISTDLNLSCHRPEATTFNGRPPISCIGSPKSDAIVAGDRSCAPMQHVMAVNFARDDRSSVGWERSRSVPRSRVAVEAAVSQVFDVLVEDLRRASRGRARVALARQVAMYLSHVGFGLSLTEVGRLFERDRTTVAHACSVVEDRRDDATFDRTLELLEWASRALACDRCDEVQSG